MTTAPTTTAPTTLDDLDAAGSRLVFESGVHGTAREFSAMCRDGLVAPVGPQHWLRADALAWPRARRQALRAALGRGMVAALDTAVWAFGGPAPSTAVLSVMVTPGTGGRPVDDGIRRYRARLGATETLRLDGLAVTDPLRTLADLAAWSGPEGELSLRWLAEQVDLTEAARALARRGPVYGAERARQVLTLLADGVADPLTRVSCGPPRSDRRHTPRTPA